MTIVCCEVMWVSGHKCDAVDGNTSRQVILNNCHKCFEIVGSYDSDCICESYVQKEKGGRQQGRDLIKRRWSLLSTGHICMIACAISFLSR